ncbi:MAG: indole-3-glycerol phosphate synthase TrpC, partial [Pseudomonadota bacterium]
MADVLERILADKRAHVEARKAAMPTKSLLRRLPDEPARDFLGALGRDIERHGNALIAEIKRASPSKGLIRADFDPASLARAYQAGGAACLSVLTDVPYFQGDDRFIAEVRAAVPLPVLRKDFIVDPYQVVESRYLGADCILIIMAAVDDDLAMELVLTARELGMAILVEAHDAAELERAVHLPVTLLGVNNRNLKTLEVDLATTEALAPAVPKGRRLVAESGLYEPADLERMMRVGARIFLVGESLMRQPDVEAATRAL